jgi:hypothetical protein
MKTADPTISRIGSPKVHFIKQIIVWENGKVVEKPV